MSSRQYKHISTSDILHNTILNQPTMRPASIFALLPAVTIALPTTETTGYELAKAIIARTAPPEAKVVLKSVTSSGSGCAANSAAFVFKDDATLAFDAMLISGSDATKTKKCLITMDLQLDSKWQYTINKATDVRGFAQGDGGASYKVTYTAGGKTVSVSVENHNHLGDNMLADL